MLLVISTAPALANKPRQAQQTAPTASCAGQTFAQPFTALNDSNRYTLVAGSEFNGSGEGWELENGAQIIQTTRPDGSSGGALDMPAGSVAISPPVCVTLQYPTARVWERNSAGGSNSVAVAYAATKSATKPKKAGQLEGGTSGWSLSQPFEVRPEIGGKEEGTREVRFVFIAGHSGDSQLYGVYVDPRMV